MPNTFETYPDARRQQKEMLRKNMVNAACELLVKGGPEALTIRNVASKLECSTKIVYSMFGSKEKLVNEMYLDGCRLLATTFDRIAPSEDPATYLNNVGEAYWDFAYKHTSYYRLMFGGALQDFQPDEKSIEETSTVLSSIATTLQRYFKEKRIVPDDPLMITQMLWTSLHGVIHLAFSGHFSNTSKVKELYQFTLNNTIKTILPN